VQKIIPARKTASITRLCVKVRCFIDASPCMVTRNLFAEHPVLEQVKWLRSEESAAKDRASANAVRNVLLRVPPSYVRRVSYAIARCCTPRASSRRLPAERQRNRTRYAVGIRRAMLRDLERWSALRIQFSHAIGGMPCEIRGCNFLMRYPTRHRCRYGFS